MGNGFFFFLQNKHISGNNVSWLWGIDWVLNTWCDRKFSEEQFSTLVFFHKTSHTLIVKLTRTRKNVGETRNVQVVFCKLSRQSFFSRQVIGIFTTHQRGQHNKFLVKFLTESKIQNRRYCEKCIVSGSQSHEIVHEHVKMRETIRV